MYNYVYIITILQTFSDINYARCDFSRLLLQELREFYPYCGQSSFSLPKPQDL